MTAESFPWSELCLKDQAIAESQAYRALRTVCLRRISDGRERKYALTCDKTGVKFDVTLTGILSEWTDENDPYYHAEAMANLRRALDGSDGPALACFLRYSPWLLSHVRLGEGLTPAQQGAVLTRLLDLCVNLLEEKGLTAGRYADAYLLLRRARFLLLARLSQEYAGETVKYLPDLDLQVREAWQAWGQTLLEKSQEMRVVLTRYGRDTDDEGAQTLFRSAYSSQLWHFITRDADWPFTERLLISWFLPRYDLVRVGWTLSQLTNTGPIEDIGQVRPGRVDRFVRRVWCGVAGHLRWMLVSQSVLLHVLTLALLSIPLVWPSLAWLWPPGVAVAWGIAGVLAVGSLVQVSVLGTRPLRYGLPRVTFAIVAGYLLLVSSDAILRFAVRAYEQQWWLAWGAALGSGLMALLAIYIEARRRLENSRLALQRAGRVWVIAAARALAIGWLILAPAGGLFLSGGEGATLFWPWDGRLGNWQILCPPLKIYPQLIFVLAPLALFVGIFVQTIWEEYTLTHPL
jgi:hypothetical protein